MNILFKLSLFFLAFAQVYLCLVPQPQISSFGNREHLINPNIEFRLNSHSRLLHDAVERYRSLIFPVKVENIRSSYLPVINRIEIETLNDSEDLNINTGKI